MASAPRETNRSDLRYGLVGAGTMGQEHIRYTELLDDVSIVAIADPHAASLAKAQDLLSHEVNTYDGHQALLAEEELDALIIATPNDTHARILLDVFASGVALPILVEKPLVTSTADVERIREAAASYPAPVWVAMEYRYMPPVQSLLENVHAGRTGTPRMLAITEHRFPFLHKVGHWNRFNRNTGGTLVEKCCHYFDLMNLVIGTRPVRVMASGGQAVNHLDETYDGERPDILDHAYVVVEYDGGARAVLDLCMFAEASTNEQELCVIGDEGKLESLVTEGILRIGRRADGIGAVTEHSTHDPRVKFEGFHHGSSYLEHLDFLDAVRSGAPAKVTLTDGLWSVAVGQAAHRSIDESRWVEVSELIGAETV